MSGIIPEWGWVVCRSRGVGFWRVGGGIGGMGLGCLIRYNRFYLVGQNDLFFAYT